MSFSIYAMFSVKSDDDYTVEVNISDWANPDEVVEEGVLELWCADIEATIEDLELEDIQVYTSDNNINNMKGSVDWKELYVGNYSHIKDFVDLPDDDDRVIALYLHIEEGIALDIACGEAKESWHRIYKDENEIIDEFVDMERINERITRMLNNELILDIYYPNRFVLPDGKVYAILE